MNDCKFDCRQCCKPNPVRGDIYVAQGKRVRERRPGLIAENKKPLTAKPRDSANLVCGIFPSSSSRNTYPKNYIIFNFGKSCESTRPTGSFFELTTIKSSMFRSLKIFKASTASAFS